MTQVQAQFYTRDDKHKIEDTVFDLRGEISCEQLNDLIDKLLKEKWENSSSHADDEAEYHNKEFDFLVEGEFLRLPLSQHVENKGLSTESVIAIEYLEKQAPPKTDDIYEHDDWVSGVHSMTGYILTGSYDCKVALWSTKHSKPFIAGAAHTEPVKSVAWLRNGEDEKHFVSTSCDQSAIIWAWNLKGETVRPIFCCRGHSKSVDCVAVNADNGVFCTGSWDTTIKVWSSSTTAQNETKEGEDFSNSKGKKKRQRIEQRGVTRVPKLTLAGHVEAVSGLAWLSSAELCSVSWDHTIRIWNIQEEKETSKIAGSKVFLACDYSQSSKLLVTGNSDRKVRLWDPRSSSGSLVETSLLCHQGWVTCVKWSPKNEKQLVSGSLDNTVKLWDIRSPKTPLYDFQAHSDKVMCLDWTCSDMILSGGADKNLYKFKL